MKIAVYYYIGFSGAKRVVQEHVKGLREKGNEVDVYTTDDAKDIFDPSVYANHKYLYKFNPVELKIPILKRIKKDYFDIFFRLKNLHRKIARDIDNRGYDIILVHTDINTQAPYLLRFLKTKNVYFCLEPLRSVYEYSLRLKDDVFFLNKAYEDLNRWIRKRIDRKNTLCANYVLALSLFGRERVIAAYDLYPKVSYLGVNEELFRIKHATKKRQIFFVAEKYPIYGYDLAIQAMNLIPKKIRPEFKIVSWTKKNSERLSDKELVDAYNESLLTLSLSRFDTFGLVPLESMACGVPVIAFNVAGYRETIKNCETGYLVDFDPEEIAQKIIYLINNTDKAREMGEKGRKWIENNWTWKHQIEKLNEYLKALVENEN